MSVQKAFVEQRVRCSEQRVRCSVAGESLFFFTLSVGERNIRASSRRSQGTCYDECPSLPESTVDTTLLVGASQKKPRLSMRLRPHWSISGSFGRVSLWLYRWGFSPCLLIDVTVRRHCSYEDKVINHNRSSSHSSYPNATSPTCSASQCYGVTPKDPKYIQGVTSKHDTKSRSLAPLQMLGLYKKEPHSQAMHNNRSGFHSAAGQLFLVILILIVILAFWHQCSLSHVRERDFTFFL